MKPAKLFRRLVAYAAEPCTVVCNIHSVCTPLKNRTYMCGSPRSGTPVIDFDSVKDRFDRMRSEGARKSVDAVALSPAGDCLCFVEMKSWELMLVKGASEGDIRRKADKYESDLPRKLTDSLAICRQIAGDAKAFDGCRIIYILLSDIDVEQNALGAFCSDLAALSGTASNLKQLCNTLSTEIMERIDDVETHYWECRRFDELLETEI
jgi:hypothetical protein